MKTFIVEVKHIFPVRYKGETYPPGSQLEVAEKDLNGDLFDVVAEPQAPKTAAKKTTSTKAQTAEEE